MTDPTLPADAATPEKDIAGDLVRRGLPLAPILNGICAAFWGMSGALSSTYAIVLVFANFLLAAGLMTWSAKISLGFYDKEALEELAEDKVLIAAARQAVSETLASRKAADLVNSEGKDRLREEILEKLNELHFTAEVTNVYITEFLVQF